MILPSLFIANTPTMNRGVFTSAAIQNGTIIEIAPVIVMNQTERALLDQTKLHDYIFEWGDQLDHCVVALGYISMYNHSYSSNCEYEMDFENDIMRIKTVRDVEMGEELFINYNGDWNNNTPLWFEAE